MDLNHLYSLRRDFTIIGLTGRTGSGCTKISERLCGSFSDLDRNGLRDQSKIELFDNEIFRRKYSISKNFLSEKNNWTPFDAINYKDILLFIIFKKTGTDLKSIEKVLLKYYKENREEENQEFVKNVISELKITFEVSQNKETINKIHAFKKTKLKSIKSNTKLLELNDVFFSEGFKKLSKDFFEILEKHGYFRRTRFLHLIACNLRGFGSLDERGKSDIKYIYTIAEIINRLIKARGVYNRKNNKVTKIVIDSLRNSLEIMFFKERFSSFFLIATKDALNNSKETVSDNLNGKVKKSLLDDVLKKLFKLDETEYKIKDFTKGEFSSPDVENCIQKSDYHILNFKKEDFEKIKFSRNDFFTREEQLMKLISLIMQPGIITPSSIERCMQVANTAKLNSGCISRKVGAAITDKNYVIKSIGWNDVAKGQTPCNLRNVEDFLSDTENLENSHYSNFERSKNLSERIEYAYKEKPPYNFKEAMNDYYKDYDKQKLEGKNCSFCFKTVHNHYENHKNQVHTRSLHAEENAMLQIVKSGGIGVEGGILFTTASPCELCSKKAYQLGINKIYYIDPYPGIAEDQILKSGSIQPEIKIFAGAVGSVYNRLYDTFLSYKDEMSLTLDLN